MLAVAAVLVLGGLSGLAVATSLWVEDGHLAAPPRSPWFAAGIALVSAIVAAVGLVLAVR